MIKIPNVLILLATESKIDPQAIKVYRFIKMYENNNKKPSKGTILSDLEMDVKVFEYYYKQLESNNIIERVRKPGEPTSYHVLV